MSVCNNTERERPKRDDMVEAPGGEREEWGRYQSLMGSSGYPGIASLPGPSVDPVEPFVSGRYRLRRRVPQFRHRTTENLDEFIAGIDVPEAPPDYRIEPNWLPMYDVNGPLMKGYSTMTGITSLDPKKRIAYNLQTTPLRLAGVRWLRSRIGTTVELNQYAEAGIEWIELPEPMPRVRLVSKAQVSADPNADIYTVDFGKVALV